MDLTSNYLGLKLKNPIVVSSCPLSETIDGIKKLEDSGASAVVMYSLFEEQIRQENEAFESLMESASGSFAESANFFPEIEDVDKGPEQYINLLSKAVEATDIPIIGSLNGITNEGWIDYAKQIQQAGASALELNIYYIASDLSKNGTEVEQRYIDILQSVKSSVDIPVAVKLSPFFSSVGHFAQRLDKVGVDGLVLFNRFFQPDFNLDTLQVEPRAHLGSAEEIRVPLLWIAVLHGQIKASLAASRGVQSSIEVIKYLLAGAVVEMVASVLMRRGPQYIQVMLDDLQKWLSARDYASLDEIRGKMSHQHVVNPGEFERVNYIKSLGKEARRSF